MQTLFEALFDIFFPPTQKDYALQPALQPTDIRPKSTPPVEPPAPSSTHCVICGSEIKTMTFKSTGVCSEQCRKNRNGEIKPQPRAIAP